MTPHIIPLPLVNVWLIFDLQKYVNWLCVFSKVNPFFQKAQVFCMDLQPAADPYNVVCNLRNRHHIHSLKLHLCMQCMGLFFNKLLLLVYYLTPQVVAVEAIQVGLVVRNNACWFTVHFISTIPNVIHVFGHVFFCKACHFCLHCKWTVKHAHIFFVTSGLGQSHSDSHLLNGRFVNVIQKVHLLNCFDGNWEYSVSLKTTHAGG